MTLTFRHHTIHGGPEVPLIITNQLSLTNTKYWDVFSLGRVGEGGSSVTVCNDLPLCNDLTVFILLVFLTIT